MSTYTPDDNLIPFYAARDSACDCETGHQRVLMMRWWMSVLTIPDSNLAAASRSRRRLLRQLYHVTNTVRRNIDLTPLINFQFDPENSPPTSPGEDDFLKSISLLEYVSFAPRPRPAS